MSSQTAFARGTAHYDDSRYCEKSDIEAPMETIWSWNTPNAPQAQPPHPGLQHSRAWDTRPVIDEPVKARPDPKMSKLLEQARYCDVSSLDDIELRQLEEALTKAVAAPAASFQGIEDGRRIQPHRRFAPRSSAISNDTLAHLKLGLGSLSEEELLSMLRKQYDNADVNGDGLLQPLEMVGWLTQEPFHLAYPQAAALTQASDGNGDGEIDFQEFVPTALALLAVAQGQSAVIGSGSLDVKEGLLRSMILEALDGGDVTRCGALSVFQVARLG